MAYRLPSRPAVLCAASVAVVALATAAMAGAGDKLSATHGPATPTAATATPTAAADVPAAMAAQADQRAAAGVIQGRYASRSGYAGAAFDPDNKTVRVFWAGDIPADLATAVSQPIHHAKVIVQKVPYSYDDFDAEMQSIAAQARAHGLKPGDISVIGPSVDRTHLEIDLASGVDAKIIDGLTHRIPYTVTVGKVELAPMVDR